MATIMTGGARRSAAPTYQQFSPQQAQALGYDPELLRRQIAEQAVASPNQQGSLAESFARGTSTLSGQGSNATFGGNAAPGTAGNVQAVGQGLSAIGMLAGSAEMAQIGGMLGLGGALGQAKSPGQALATIAGPALSLAGIPGNVLGLGTAAVQGNIPGMVNSALSFASPQLAALNALSGLLGIGTVGSALAGTPGKFNDEDGTYTLGTPGLLAGITDSIGYGGSYSGTVGGVNGSYANPGLGAMTSNPVRSTSGGSGGSFGGYGGGIGQSGGNASGMGSSQA